jgi:hypothetical protein
MTIRSRAGIGAIVVVLAMLLVGIGIAYCDSHSTPTSSLTVQGTVEGQPLPNGFLGVSFEYRGLEAYLGSNPAALDPFFVQAIRNLAPGQNPVVRIGGDSTDWSWWPVPRMAQPGGVKYVLNNVWTGVARALAGALKAKLLLGVNFEADSSVVAATEANAFLKHIGPRAIDAFELGNEPELYEAFSWYKTAAGKKVYGRPHGYTFQDYEQDYAKIAAAMPKFPLAGPSAGSPNYLAGLGSFISSARQLGLVTIHAYPLKHCSSVMPTISELLAPAASASLAYQSGQYAKVAAQHGLKLRIDEMNSVSCGGERGVSTAFAAALWSLGQLFQLDLAGIDGVNFHTVPDTINQLIGAQETGGKWTGEVEPEYYGLVAFAQAAPAGARLRPVTGALPSGVQAYATVAPTGQVHVVVINTTHGTRNFDVRVDGSLAAGALALLRAPSLAASSGESLGGQTISPATGALSGAPQTTAVAPSGGTYDFKVPPGSAAILAIAPGSYSIKRSKRA